MSLPRPPLSALCGLAFLALTAGAAAAPSASSTILLEPVRIELTAGEARNLEIDLGGALEIGFLYKAELPAADISRDAVTLGFVVPGEPEGGTPLEGEQVALARRGSSLGLRVIAGRCCGGTERRLLELLPPPDSRTAAGGVQDFLRQQRLRGWVEEPAAKVTSTEASRPPAPAPDRPLPPPPPPPLPDPNWDKGPAGAVDLFVLSQEKRWKLGTAKVVDAGGEAVEDMRAKLKLLLWQLRMDYGDLIAVGTASCEGILGRESSRAGRRSEHLVEWLREALADLDDPEPRQIYRLNLGQFRECRGFSPDETDDQRRVIVLAIRNRDHGLDLDALREKLRQDLSTHRPLGFDPADYSEFSLHEAR